MNTQLQKLINALEFDNKRVFEMLSGLNEDQLNYAPRTNRWSINQVLVHLLASERLSMAYIKKKSLGIEGFENSGWREALKSIILMLSQRLPIKFKVPKVIREQTPDVMPLAELAKQFDYQLVELRNFLETIEEKNIRKKIFKHPRVGMLNVMQGVDFFLEHRIHHRPQIKSLIKISKVN